MDKIGSEWERRGKGFLNDLIELKTLVNKYGDSGSFSCESEIERKEVERLFELQHYFSGLISITNFQDYKKAYKERLLLFFNEYQDVKEIDFIERELSQHSLRPSYQIQGVELLELLNGEIIQLNYSKKRIKEFLNSKLEKLESAAKKPKNEIEVEAIENDCEASSPDIKQFVQPQESISDTPESNKKESHDPVFLTRKQVAEMFHCDISTVHNWTKKGKLTPYLKGRRVYYKRDEVLASTKPLNGEIN